ncbi:prolyl oligopeptidase family serine peptidase [Cytophaga sp. FL35]|uniref:carboxylesterase family protein n=1 Tax=Cytophaga sp. FL35 TaxID=1904456 RepID=UPI001653E7CA|nr:prolyl oligopeptidase family serine peptidase [Cytophaga sp. FL35]MBC6999967.1 prolyl oligopeptidase family serine peptidase [Cytophaga sp. FL35]
MEQWVRHRKFYSIGICLWSLVLFLSAFKGILFLIFQAKTSYFNTYSYWLIGYGFIFTASQLIQICYYLSNKQSWAAIACASYQISCLALFIVTYFMVTSQQLERFHLSIQNLMLLSILLYGLVLILSVTRKKKWLKIAGWSLLLIGITYLTLFYAKNFTSSFELQLELTKALHITSLLSSLVAIPFILNFKKELKTLRTTEESAFSRSFKGVVGLLVSLALVLSIFLFRDVLLNTLRQPTPTTKQREIASAFKAFTYTNTKGQKLPYRLLLPSDYQPNNNYPLAICLHHGGGNGTDNVRQVEASMFARTLSEPENQQKFPAILFVPQAPPGSCFGGIPEYEDISGLVMEAIEEIEATYSVDTNRRYVMGMSLGGFGTWTLIGNHPQQFAAAMPVCGGGDPAKAENMLQTPIWAFHGAEDQNVPVQLSQDMVNAIRKKGGEPKYTEYKNVGHNVWNHVENTPGKLEWIFDQSLAN